jgi:serine/threonine-protein kinase
LAAAIAAGETPSPELVAAAGKSEGLGMRAAWICLALTFAGVIAAAAVGGPTQWLDRAPMEYPGEALAAKARDLIERVGYREPPQDRAWGWGLSGSFVEYAYRHANAKQAHLTPYFVWYRQSSLPSAEPARSQLRTRRSPNPAWSACC